MPQLFSRRLLGLILLLILPAAVLAQSRTKTTPPATPSTETKPAAQNQKAKAPAKGEKQASASAQTKSKEAKGKFTLKIASGPVRAVDLRANDASVAEIAAKLSKEFDIPVLLSPVMQKARVSIEFEGMPLEGAVRMIAPQPFADYEISGDGSAMARMVALYLYAVNEPPPSESAVVRGDSEAILISGNTDEEGTETATKDEQEASLSVKIERNQFTVRARKQPLTAVLYEIASKVDIPFEMKYDSSEVVNVDLNNVTMEQVVRTLSPNIRLYQRTDLQTYETKPLRLVLAHPTSQTIKL